MSRIMNPLSLSSEIQNILTEYDDLQHVSPPKVDYASCTMQKLVEHLFCRTSKWPNCTFPSSRNTATPPNRREANCFPLGCLERFDMRWSSSSSSSSSFSHAALTPSSKGLPVHSRRTEKCLDESHTRFSPSDVAPQGSTDHRNGVLRHPKRTLSFTACARVFYTFVQCLASFFLSLWWLWCYRWVAARPSSSFHIEAVSTTNSTHRPREKQEEKPVHETGRSTPRPRRTTVSLFRHPHSPPYPVLPLHLLAETLVRLGDDYRALFHQLDRPLVEQSEKTEQSERTALFAGMVLELVSGLPTAALRRPLEDALVAHAVSRETQILASVCQRGVQATSGAPAYYTRGNAPAAEVEDSRGNQSTMPVPTYFSSPPQGKPSHDKKVRADLPTTDRSACLTRAVGFRILSRWFGEIGVPHSDGDLFTSLPGVEGLWERCTIMKSLNSGAAENARCLCYIAQQLRTSAEAHLCSITESRQDDVGHEMLHAYDSSEDAAALAIRTLSCVGARTDAHLLQENETTRVGSKHLAGEPHSFLEEMLFLEQKHLFYSLLYCAQQWLFFTARVTSWCTAVQKQCRIGHDQKQNDWMESIRELPLDDENNKCTLNPIAEFQELEVANALTYQWSYTLKEGGDALRRALQPMGELFNWKQDCNANQQEILKDPTSLLLDVTYSREVDLDSCMSE